MVASPFVLFFCSERRLRQILDEAIAPVKTLLKELKTMTDEVKALLDLMNTETNDIATKIDADVAAIAKLQSDLSAALAAAGQPAPVDTELVARLTALSGRLKGLAADPANPVPVVVVPVTPPTV